MSQSPSQLVSELGSHLSQYSRPNKDFLLKSLRQAACALSQIEQPPSAAAAGKKALKGLQAEILPLKKSIIKHGLVKHNDKEVRLLVAICITEIFRISAPEPPFEDKYLRDIFKLILGMVKELPDTTSPYFSKRVKILETLAWCRCSVILLDIESHDMVNEMFDTFFSIVRESHQRSLIDSILSIMSDLINEEVTPSLVDIVLRNLVKEGKTATAACDLSFSFIQQNAEKLEPFICGFLNSCFVGGDVISSDLKESYHDIMFKLSQSVPHMLLPLVSNLNQELQTDQIDARIKAIDLIGRIIALPGHGVSKLYDDLFVEFLKRFSDKSAEVRIKALQCGRDCYIAYYYKKEAAEVFTAIEGRLLDFDDRVRMQAVVVVCDLMKFNLRNITSDLVARVSERLRDKKISVRKKALQKLTEVYRDYCNMCFEGHMTGSDQFEMIPCKILLLTCEKECTDFRTQNMEPIISEDLFPASLPVEERMQHWVHFSSHFNSLHLKAFNSILSQKRRVQAEMQLYLVLRKKEKEHSLEEMQRKLNSSFTKMGAFFPDPSKAEECFRKLNQAKDNRLFDTLSQILEEPSFEISQSIRKKFLKMIGHKHPQFDFLQLVVSKCSCNIFSSDHVRYITNQLCSNNMRSEKAKSSMLKLLVAVVRIFPLYLRGSEDQFLKFLEVNEKYSDELIEVLAKASPWISAEFSSYYPFLEKVCLEGSRLQAKYAVSAIASLFGSSKEFAFPKLCKVLVRSLDCEANLPTILQSLGCIGQYSISAFEAADQDIRAYIFEKILQAEPSNDQDVWNETQICSYSCKLKIYGLKTLVKSFLPHHGHCQQSAEKLNDLFNVLERMLKFGDTYDEFTSCERDRAHMRLAAAKSVLRLSRMWDIHIPPQVFHLTIFTAKDTQSYVRRSFIYKIQLLLKERSIPSRYACALLYALSDCDTDLEDNSFRYTKEFIRSYGKEAQTHQESEKCQSITKYPAYIVVFLVHVMVHDPGFPSLDSKDAKEFARFCCPLFLALRTLLGSGKADTFDELVNESFCCLLFIFQAIKRAEDAVDADKTYRLHILADIGISALHVLRQNDSIPLRAPGSILLPSTFYKAHMISRAKFFLDQSFVDEVIHILVSLTSLSTDNLTKVPKKDNNLPLVSSIRGPIAGGKTDVGKKNVEQGLDSRHSRKRALSPLRGSCIEKHNSIKTRNTPSLTVEEQISSFSLEQLPANLGGNIELSSGDGVTIMDKHAKSSNSRTLKDISNQCNAILGNRFKSLSSIDGNFLSATVHKCDSKSSEYKEKEGNSATISGSEYCLEETIVTSEKIEARQRGSERERRNLPRSLPPSLADKEVDIGSSSSEVVNSSETVACRRTRRRKA